MAPLISMSGVMQSNPSELDDVLTSLEPRCTQLECFACGLRLGCHKRSACEQLAGALYGIMVAEVTMDVLERYGMDWSSSGMYAAQWATDPRNFLDLIPEN